MARKIIKPVFSRPREIRVLSQEDWLAHHCLSTRKAQNESFVSVCSERLPARVVPIQVLSWWRSLK